MKKYRDVVVTGNAQALAVLRTRLATGPWPNRLDLATGSVRQEALPLVYAGEDAPKAIAWIFFYPELAEVTNIVPSEVGELTHEQYNLIAQRLAEDVLRPPAQELGLQVELGPTSYTLRDVAPEIVASALEQFSSAANKATGAAHPLDAARWDTFLIAAHAEAAELDSDDLHRWLVEDQGWDQSVAHERAIEYERARRLLTLYDEQRRS